MRVEELGFDDVKMTVLEEYPIGDGTPLEMKKKLERRERELVIELNPKYNKNLPAGSRAEHLDNQRQYNRNVRKSPENADKLKAYIKASYERSKLKTTVKVECPQCGLSLQKRSLNAHIKHHY